MEALVDQLEFPIDFKGQAKAERLSTILVYSGVVIALLAGLITQNLTILFYVFFSCLVATLAVVVPAYPFYKKNPPQWLKVKYDF
jgi:signal peptidase complex subunit 1